MLTKSKSRRSNQKPFRLNSNSGLWLPFPFAQLTPGGLWIPVNRIENTQQRKSPFFGVSLGYADIFGGQSTWKDVTDRLEHYSLSQIMDVIGRISSVLNHFGHDRRQEAHSQLCDIIFGKRSSGVREAVKQWLESRPKEKHAPFYTMFHKLQLVNTAKIALLTLPPDDRPHNNSMEALGEALLMVTELINRETASGVAKDDTNTPDGFRRWHQFFLTNALFNAADNPVHALARSYDLYLTDKPQLKDCEVYLNFPSLVNEVTGMSPELLGVLMFSLYGHWYGIKDDNAGTAPGPIEFDTYFTKHCNFSNAESEQFFSLIAEDAREHVRQLEKRGCSPQNLKPYDNLTFEDKPLVLINGKVYCVSIKLLLHKLTRGFHYLFLNKIKSRQKRDQYLTYMGHVFDDYVHRIWDRAFPPGTGRFVSGKELEAHAAGEVEVCDGAIVYPDAVILIESKATLMPLEVRTAAKWSVYESKIESMFLKAAAQFQSTISEIETGRYSALGLKPDKIRKYFPVIVTLENLPMNGLFYEKIYTELTRRALLQEPKIRPLQVIDAGDCEFLELAVAEGHSIHELLEDKTSNDKYRGESFGNYCLRCEKDFTLGTNGYLAELFKEIGERAESLIHSVSKPSYQSNEIGD